MIDQDEFTLHYITVDQVIRVVSKHGVGALMAKFDAEAAYRYVSVHPSHCVLLGMKWRDQFYMDMVLPFGLRSEPGSLGNGATDKSLNPLLVTCIMLLKWCGWGGPSYAVSMENFTSLSSVVAPVFERLARC